MTEDDKDFCGYVCGPELDKVKSFVETLRPLLRVNPELVKVMIGKARNEIYLFEEDIWREERKAKPRTKEDHDYHLKIHEDVCSPTHCFCGLRSP